MAKGLTPGAALVLLMAGPAVNSASMLVIGKVFGRRTFCLYVLSIVIGAMLFGLGIDYLLPQEWFDVSSFATLSSEHCMHCLDTWDWALVCILIALILNAFFMQHHNKQQHDSEGHILSYNLDRATTIYSIQGMSCNHCKANVERAIAAVEGVEHVEVDLTAGKAYVCGKHDQKSLIEAVSAIGYGIEKTE